MIMSLLPCNCVMFVYIAYNLVMFLFFFFISLPFTVNKRFSIQSLEPETQRESISRCSRTYVLFIYFRIYFRNL